MGSVEICPVSNGFVLRPSIGFMERREMISSEVVVFETFESLIENLRGRYLEQV